MTIAEQAAPRSRGAELLAAARTVIPGGVIAIWCYVMCRLEPAMDAILDAYYGETVGPYWLPERALVEDGYRSIAFPFEEIATPPFAIVEALTLDRLAGYVRTWSSTRRYVAARGSDPVETLVRDLTPLWGDPNRTRLARWPLHVRAGRRP